MHSFGRADQVDEASLRRLAASLRRCLGDTDDAAGAGSSAVMPEPVDSRPASGALVLDGVWKQLGLDRVIGRAEIFTQLGLPAPRQVQGLTSATTRSSPNES